MQEKALKLGLAVYRVTKKFPEGEVLIGQIRKTANQVLEETILKQDKKAIQQIQILLNYFQIAKAQKWTQVINFVILEREYRKLLEELKSKPRKKISVKGLSQRQKKILEYIEDKKGVKFKELSNLFDKVTPRTIRNDLSSLIEKGILSQQGRGRASVYKLIRK